MRPMFCISVLAFFSLAVMASAQEISDSSTGFDHQYQELFKAFQADDQREFKLLADEFAIPAHWFPTVFGVDQGEVLAKQYAEEFSDFEPHLMRNFQLIESWKVEHHIEASAPTRIKIQQWLRPDDPKNLAEPVPASLVPLPAVDKFHI